MASHQEKAIYRHYDQAGLDAQLNLRQRWPEHPAYFARWAQESARRRQDPRAQLDLAYGKDPAESLNLYLPAGKGPWPLLFFIHGGYWQSLDKNDFDYLAGPFLDQNLAFATINYPLAPAVRIRDLLASVGKALDWIAGAAPRLGLDASNVVVAGHSAGGHLAACLALGLTNTFKPKSALSVSGVYDLAPIALSYHNAVLALDAEEVTGLSPLGLNLSETATITLAVGGEETEEFLFQQDRFAARLGAKGQVVDLPGRNHFTAIDALGEPEHALHRAALALFG